MTMQSTTLSKRAHKVAERNSLSLELNTLEINDQVSDYIEIYPVSKGEVWEEFIASYRVNYNGSFSYHGSCFPGDYDMPAHIPDEKALVALLPEFAKVVASL